MPRPRSVWQRKGRAGWWATIGSRKVFLGHDRDEAQTIALTLQPEPKLKTKESVHERAKRTVSRPTKKRNPDTLKAAQLRAKLRGYGLSHSEFLQMRESQNNRCAICRTDFVFGRECIDHCHKTGKVRGFLCGRCNTGIGCMYDSPKILRAAIRYLETHKKNTRSESA
jgi:hypothetical protein